MAWPNSFLTITISCLVDPNFFSQKLKILHLVMIMKKEKKIEKMKEKKYFAQLMILTIGSDVAIILVSNKERCVINQKLQNTDYQNGHFVKLTFKTFS